MAKEDTARDRDFKSKSQRRMGDSNLGPEAVVPDDLPDGALPGRHASPQQQDDRLPLRGLEGLPLRGPIQLLEHLPQRQEPARKRKQMLVHLLKFRIAI